MTVHLHHVATAVPAPAYPQAAARDVMRSWIGGDRRTDRLLGRVYGHSGIETRHSVLEDFLGAGRGADTAFRSVNGATGAAPEAVAAGVDAVRVAPAVRGGGFFANDAGGFRNPGTAERNARYRAEAEPLFARVSQAALDGADDVRPDEVTHLITVSCTGFYAPGPDLDVVRSLGLRPGTERYHLGFMGCYAAFPALRMARAFCRADPDAVVLIAAVELCTLHLQPSRDTDAVVAASVFADGLAPEGASDMAWTIGDHGFEMVLSAYVPKIVGEKAHAALGPLLTPAGLEAADVRRWAVHPGGRAILDRLGDGLDLAPDALAASRSALARYGNMSSATVLFVLAEMLADPAPTGEPLIAMAFGPGLTVASGLLRAA